MLRCFDSGYLDWNENIWLCNDLRLELFDFCNEHLLIEIVPSLHLILNMYEACRKIILFWCSATTYENCGRTIIALFHHLY